MRVRFIVFILSFFFVSTSHCYAETETRSLNVFAAASLTDALKEIGTEFEKEYGIAVNFNFGSSDRLRVQVERGAPCDIYFSASAQNVERLVQGRLVNKTDVRHVLGNQLVVVTHADNDYKISDIYDLGSNYSGRIAIGDPDHVPAGRYAREAFLNTRMWGVIVDRTVPVVHVRAALLQAENKNTDFAIVYRTDLSMTENLRELFAIPQGLHSSIRYPICIIKQSAKQDLSKKFLTFLEINQIKEIFRSHGFKVF